MLTAIIHRPARVDRIQQVAKLQEAHPGAVVVPAREVPWEPPASGAVRGCALSHLDAVRSALRADRPVLVLEDDAVIRPDAWAAFDIAKVPEDAGVVLLGTESDRHGAPDANGFRVVQPPNWGTHAVLYMPALLRSPFFFNAFRILASHPIGREAHLPPDVIGLCYESVLHMALEHSGLTLVRPARITHTTSGGVSDRTKQQDAPRVRNMDMPLNENLEDLLTWNSLTGAVTRDTLAAEVRGKKVAIVGRDCIGVPPDVDIVVHVNHGRGLTSVPRCDHVVTVTNTHLFATMRELPEGLKQARVFITRDADRNDTALYAQVFGVSPDKMLSASGDDPQWTSGVWALKLYESLGAEVYAVGFSADRTERYQPGHWHSPRAKDEQTYLQKLKDDGRFFATEVL